MPLFPILLAAHLGCSAVTASLATYNASHFRTYPMFKSYGYPVGETNYAVGFDRVGSGKCLCEPEDTFKHPHHCPTEPPTNHMNNFFANLAISFVKWPVYLAQNTLLLYALKTNQMQTLEFPLEEDSDKDE